MATQEHRSRPSSTCHGYRIIDAPERTLDLHILRGHETQAASPSNAGVSWKNIYATVSYLSEPHHNRRFLLNSILYYELHRLIL